MIAKRKDKNEHMIDALKRPSGFYLLKPPAYQQTSMFSLIYIPKDSTTLNKTFQDLAKF
jgi:hypothetical protein